MSDQNMPVADGASDRYNRVCQIFQDSLKVDAKARLEWIEVQAGGDEVLLAELKAMLLADEGFIEPTTKATEQWNSESADQDAAPSNGSGRTHPCIPNYEILGEIAHGGMGVVYKARQLRPHRLVALKMMRRGHFASESERARFRSEAEAAAQLDDTTVVPIYEVHEHEGEPFFTMKLVEGMNFEQQLRSCSMSINEVIATLLPVCHAMAAAHEKGIVHRDLKPSNILIDGVTQQPWVADFGLAKNVHDSQCYTAAGIAMGTIGYMAPEQTLGHSKAISPATDVYGLGAILYRALTGFPPIVVDGDNPVDVEQQIRHNDIVPPRSRNRLIPRALDSICMKCLETEPSNRYTTAQELEDDLKRFIDGDAVMARPLSFHRRTLRWARTHPGLAASWCAIAVFFAYHLLCLVTGTTNSMEFEVATLVITPVALVSAWVWQQVLSRTQGEPWVLYAWTASDVFLLTALAMFAAPENSTLVMLYPVIVAASALRCRPNLVGFVTAVAVAGYTIREIVVRVVYDANASWVDIIPMVLCMAVIGLIQYLLLRRSAASLEAKSALFASSQFMGRTGTSRNRS
ncbi:serine/threonine protein kinase [Aeoliella sp. ICT_H6.2]|uniref:Serine/threonine protein kinase n=1 Tax=Aeoliella straminimaris TaxID=2954799 RepID=A0A9X2JGF5_9BACT|nr:serine/threonine-protein kinase [Aeoliella straminimaris]MCO6044681.1 serine/threonine protein kinase [Aeoliella straminimaris]